MNQNPFMEPADETLSRLQVDPETGLSSAQVKNNQEQYGPNAFTRERPLSLAQRILHALAEPMVIMLLLAAVITLGVNIIRGVSGGETDFIECVGIFFAISLSTAITVIMEGKSAKAFETLNKLNEDIQVRILRDGKTQMISQQEVTIGDILYLETGNKLPADCRLLESTDLTADESALTGESVPVNKNAAFISDSEKTPIAERINMLYSGCYITSGKGRAVVTAIGDHTEFGKIAGELSAVKSDSSTPLQEKLARLGKKIALLGATAAAIVFIVQVYNLLTTGTASLETISDAFITSIVLIVAAVPEGLPTIMAVSMAIHIVKMSRQNALVKKMVACETIGCVNVICSDKTGTLTENRMTVTDVYSVHQENALLKPQKLQDDFLLQNFCLNSTADVHFEEKQPQFIGNPTECALLTAAYKAGTDYQTVRRQIPVQHVFPFSSEMKYMTTIVPAENQLLAFSKGSPEKIIAMCSGTLNSREQQKIEQKIAGFQENACRVIGFAHKIFAPVENFEKQRASIESGMIFDGFVAISDPLREDVLEAVSRCRDAGIGLKMLTGDNIITASAIARELQILDDQNIATEASALENLSDEELTAMLPQIRVIARSTPTIKMRVVNCLKAAGNVVAVTGDGINDAPAIKNADVGIAMGITGTEVSKEASDLVLLDDSFSTIVKAIQWGRGIYDNLQRFIQFQLTANVSSVLIVLVSILSGLAAPFSALQLLWINIIMDGPSSLTLGLEPVRGDLMGRQPTRRNAGILSKSMFFHIFFNGLLIFAVCMLQYWTNFLGGTPEQQSSILFTLFVLFQLFNAFNSRELDDTSIFRHIGGNKPMLLVFAATFLLQILITQFGGAIFDISPLPFLMWIKVTGVAVTVVIVSELIKCIQRRFHRIHSAKPEQPYSA